MCQNMSNESKSTKLQVFVFTLSFMMCMPASNVFSVSKCIQLWKHIFNVPKHLQSCIQWACFLNQFCSQSCQPRLLYTTSSVNLSLTSAPAPGIASTSTPREQISFCWLPLPLFFFFDEWRVLLQNAINAIFDKSKARLSWHDTKCILMNDTLLITYYTDIDRTVMKYHVSVHCQESYILPRDYNFPKCAALRENIVPRENITILAPPTRDISSVPVDICYIRWSKWMISSKLYVLYDPTKFGNKTRSLRTKQNWAQTSQLARVLLWRSIVNHCVLCVHGAFLSGSVS